MLESSGPTLTRNPSPAPVVLAPSMEALYDRVDRLASLPMPVLIRGETGAGKELVARALHYGGSRANEPMEAVNCGAFPPNLVESMLFGHVRGSFTGAVESATGLIEAAGTGTLFLDEIGELPPTAQASLLRVLSEGTVRPVGATKETRVEARIVAATHRNLEKMVEAGTFRQDLYYRLAGITLEVPPLRERVEEIAPLAEQLMASINTSNGTRIRRCAPEALALLKAYAWPGNVRELRSVMEEAMAFCDEEVLRAAHLPSRVRSRSESSGAVCEMPELDGDDLRSRVKRYEAELIVAKLNEASWSQSKAARELGLPPRLLLERMQTLGIRKGHACSRILSTLDDGAPLPLSDAMDRFRRRVILDALERTSWNVTEAAQSLRVARSHLYGLMAKCGIDSLNPRQVSQADNYTSTV